MRLFVKHDVIGQNWIKPKYIFFRLLLRLPPLRALEPNILEELFFAGLIGQVQIDSVIPYILRMGNSISNPGNNRQVKSEHLEEFMCK